VKLNLITNVDLGLSVIIGCRVVQKITRYEFDLIHFAYNMSTCLQWLTVHPFGGWAVVRCLNLIVNGTVLCLYVSRTFGTYGSAFCFFLCPHFCHFLEAAGVLDLAAVWILVCIQ